VLGASNYNYAEATSYQSVNAILKSDLDKEEPAIAHPNIRGSGYFEGEPVC